METPGGKSKPGEKVGTPLTEVIHRNMKVALANSTGNNSPDMQAISASPQFTKTTEKEVKYSTLRLFNADGGSLRIKEVSGLRYL